MKILVDIGHPAHIHYFRNAIKNLQEKGHEFLITTRDKEIAIELLKTYGFAYICTGKNRSGMINKFRGLLQNNIAIYKAAKKFKPDIFLSFYSPFAAQVGWWLRKPVIGFADTEFAKFSIKITKPFTDYHITPYCFTELLGTNHYYFKGFMETFYLHPDYYRPDPIVMQMLGVQPGERYFLMRFVSFQAGHDTGESGIDDQSKRIIAEHLSSKGRLFISSEAPLPPHFEKFRIRISPHHFHSALAFADLYVGEGITTASECAHLGTPAVLINTLTTGYIGEQVKRGLIHRFDNATDALPVIKQLLENPENKKKALQKSNNLISGMIDCTQMLVRLIDEFPGSINKLQSELFLNKN